MRRELRSVQTEQVVGAVAEPDQFEGAANSVLGRMRRELGDRETVAIVMREGWSNGYLYFAEPV